MKHHHRPVQLPAFPRCRERTRQESQPPAIKSLNRIQAWLITLTLLQGVALLALFRMGPMRFRWSAPSPRPEVAIAYPATNPSHRSV
jgi:hypothetical protein